MWEMSVRENIGRKVYQAGFLIVTSCLLAGCAQKSASVMPAGPAPIRELMEADAGKALNSFCGKIAEVQESGMTANAARSAHNIPFFIQGQRITIDQLQVDDFVTFGSSGAAAILAENGTYALEDGNGSIPAADRQTASASAAAYTEVKDQKTEDGEEDSLADAGEHSSDGSLNERI
jgi:hypothetical protein